ESGIDLTSIMGETPEQDPLLVPPGFRSAERLGEQIQVPGRQFRGRVLPLERRDYTLPVVEFVSDQDIGDRRKAVRVCDLRPETARALKGSSPASADQGRLDAAFYRDLK